MSPLQWDRQTDGVQHFFARNKCTLASRRQTSNYARSLLLLRVVRDSCVQCMLFWRYLNANVYKYLVRQIIAVFLLNPIYKVAQTLTTYDSQPGLIEL